SSRRRHTRSKRDWSSDVCSSDLIVSNHLVSVGELVGVASPTQLATIVQLDPIYVNFNVNEQDVQRVRDEARRRGITTTDLRQLRSEERRVGKEQRARKEGRERRK